MAALAQRRVNAAHQVLPRNLAVLGDLGACVLHNPYTSEFVPFNPRTGTVLCSDADGEELFFIRPKPGKSELKLSDQALRARDLHERFVHRAGDGFYNCIVPAFHTPRFVGELMTIRYETFKDLPGLGGRRGDVVEWEHYFEEPGVAPAYAQLWAVGNHQYWVPRGPFAVTDDGICFHPRRSR